MNIMTYPVPLIVTLLLSVSFASAAGAATQDFDAGDLLKLQEQGPVVGTKVGFIWSPGIGFVSTQLPSGDGGERFIGTAGSDIPGRKLAWHPEFGLVPDNFQPDVAQDRPPVDWSATGNATRVVVWQANWLQALLDQRNPGTGFTVSEVIDVAPDGTILGVGQPDPDGAPQFFVWKEDSAPHLLQPDAGLTFVSVSALSGAGQVIAQAMTPEGVQIAVLVSPDGALQPLSGPDATPSVAKGINATGQVVGSAGEALDIAVLWNGSDAPVILSDQLSSPLPEGFRLFGANDINTSGQIAATAVTPTGSVHLMMLSPDPVAPGLYVPRNLGEIFAAGSGQTVPMLALTDSGDIVGSCGIGAESCPISPFDVADLDPDITNLADIGDDTFLPFILSTSGEPGAAAPGARPRAANSRAAGSRPNLGTSLLPRVGGGASPLSTAALPLLPFEPESTSDQTPDTSGAPGSGNGTGNETGANPPITPVPLPVAGWLLMSGLILLKGSSWAMSGMRRLRMGRTGPRSA